ncbi:MAG: 50S ribosomal protein L15 [Francisellaceae bacterium]|jgi:large subunit ribosomal protein L15|nr:50S ribosomal protein L15 [Francisellaceae bacterium]MBT6539111.1 50S ribosomal protein L15 [Francisellaceae bacterium]
MRLNELSPAAGAKKAKNRAGRGIGCGLGKTCGRGHKGQKARSGGSRKAGFEGGQMPLHIRLPKFGFSSRKSAKRTEIRLDLLEKLADKGVIDILMLKDGGLIGRNIESVKVIKAGELSKAVQLRGIRVTNGAREVIESVGGKIEE